MKICSMFHVLAFVMTVLIFGMPLVTIAQQGTVQAEAVADAEADAEADVNKTLWLAAGCLLTGAGVIGAYFIEPTPPAAKLMGKSPEYVAFYTDAYKAKSKNLQGRSALIGCAVGGCTYLGVYVLVVSAALAGD